MDDKNIQLGVIFINKELLWESRYFSVCVCVRLAYPDHVVDTVDVGVSHVDSDSTQCEAVPLPRAQNGDGRA